jgi:hypothetical protein
LVVPSLLAVTPGPAVGWPFVSSGGQVVAQLEEHVDEVPRSARKRYKVFPDGPTRIWPRGELAVSTTAGPLAPVEPDGEADVVVVVVDFEVHPTAATRKPAASTEDSLNIRLITSLRSMRDP